MKRVIIVGPGAAGKSTLAARLGGITGLPVIELDKLFWRPGLAPTPRDEWAVIQRRLAAQESWIMDGDLGPYDVLDVRLHAADAIVFLDFSPFRAQAQLVPPVRLCSLPPGSESVMTTKTPYRDRPDHR